MENREFDNVNNMKKNKIYNSYYVYYVDSYQIKYLDFLITNFYVADKKITIDEYTKIKINSDDYLIIETDYGDEVPRCFKAFKTKEAALLEVERIQGRKYEKNRPTN